MLARNVLGILAVAAAAGCSSSGAGGGPSAPSSLVGDYVRAKGSPGTIQEMLFTDASHFELLPVNCTSLSRCGSTGTYTFDGTTLAMTDSKTGKTRTLAVKNLAARETADTAAHSLLTKSSVTWTKTRTTNKNVPLPKPRPPMTDGNGDDDSDMTSSGDDTGDNGDTGDADGGDGNGDDDSANTSDDPTGSEDDGALVKSEGKLVSSSDSKLVTPATTPRCPSGQTCAASFSAGGTTVTTPTPQ